MRLPPPLSPVAEKRKIDVGRKPGSTAGYGIDGPELKALLANLRDPYGLPPVAVPTASEACEEPAR
ncbi:hypothetical protein V5E97_26760 [Singulisphaera sp. Ch08]|uniref:Uncharacterized protein n=1 Tax=Singulisphaera sp. Ch08 TaxID=3120278 RepID=A0AAU7C9V4_9BACT